ncbi:MAG TPA: hypothetical protein VF737_09865, partial [Gemmatimonadaceae bacterium]
AADGAIVDALASWDSAARFRQPAGSTDALPGPWAQAWPVDGSVTRLSASTYRVAARAVDIEDTSLTAWSAGVLYVDLPRFASPAALIAHGDIRVDGSLAVLPADSASAAVCDAPPGWSGGILAAPGYAVPAGATVDPRAADDSTYAVFGGVTRADLASRADLALAGGSVVSAPVGNVTHAAGDLELTGGNGSGLLLVDGALRLSGSVVFRGVVVVAGGVTVANGTLSLAGQMRSAGGAAAVAVNTPAAMELRFDPCVIRDVEWHAGRVKLADFGSPPPRF